MPRLFAAAVVQLLLLPLAGASAPIAAAAAGRGDPRGEVGHGSRTQLRGAAAAVADGLNTSSARATVAAGQTCDNSQDPCDFGVHLTVDNNPYYGYAYSYFRNDDWGVKEDWSAQREELLDDGSQIFTYLQTVQFVVSDLSVVQKLYVDDVENGLDCAGFYWGKWSQFGRLGESWDIQSIVSDSGSSFHMTVVPFQGNGVDCQPTDINFDGTRALSIWIAQKIPEPPVNEQRCKFSFDEANLRTIDEDHCLKAPYWQVSPQGEYLIFKGSLVDALSDKPGDVLNIYLEEGVSFDKVYLPGSGDELGHTPLNTMLLRFKISPDTRDACSRFAATQGADSGDSCQVYPLEELTLGTTKHINVWGHGRITGFDEVDKFLDRPSVGPWEDKSGPKAVALVTTDWDLRYYAQYRVYSGLLVLSSSYGVGDAQADYAIDVAGVTVGFGPKRNAGAVQLNAAYTPAVFDPDGEVNVDSNNVKVKVFDFKAVGNWIDASDGPEVMGQFSYLESIYLHVNDDSIKVGTNDMKITKATVLQGNAGGVINLGCYGKNRGSIERSTVSQVWVHRVTHNHLSGSPGYDGRNGLVTTRQCPQKPLCQDCDRTKANLQDATVQDLTVVGLGWGWDAGGAAVPGPNSVTRPVAIGSAAANQDFCGSTVDDDDFASEVTFSGLRFLDWNVYTNPVDDSLFYNDAAGAIEFHWGLPGSKSVSFFDGWEGTGAKKKPNAPVKLFKLEESAEYYYDICGDLSIPPTCWTSSGKGVDASANVFFEESPAVPGNNYNIDYPW